MNFFLFSPCVQCDELCVVSRQVRVRTEGQDALSVCAER